MKIVTDKDGMPVLNDNGVPKYTLDADDEKKALRNLSQSDIRSSLCTDRRKDSHPEDCLGHPATAYPDSAGLPHPSRWLPRQHDAEERVKNAETEMTAMFGQSERLEEEPVSTHDELVTIRELEGADLTEEHEREAVNSSIEERAAANMDIIDDAPSDAPIRRVGGDDQMWDLSEEALGGAEPVGAGKKTKKS